jgi:putative transposase
MKVYRGFPQRLHHKVPDWVEDGALFHIRIALDRDIAQRPLIDPPLGTALLEGAKLYEAIHRWHLTIFLLMPDHLHTILSFPREESMGRLIGDWKRFYKRNHTVEWQEDFFDHRLRDDERGEQLSIKLDYIRRNPVVAGLCQRPEDWPWVIDPYRSR